MNKPFGGPWAPPGTGKGFISFKECGAPGPPGGPRKSRSAPAHGRRAGPPQVRRVGGSTASLLWRERVCRSGRRLRVCCTTCSLAFGSASRCAPRGPLPPRSGFGQGSVWAAGMRDPGPQGLVGPGEVMRLDGAHEKSRVRMGPLAPSAGSPTTGMRGAPPGATGKSPRWTPHGG